MIGWHQRLLECVGALSGVGEYLGATEAGYGGARIEGDQRRARAIKGLRKGRVVADRSGDDWCPGWVREPAFGTTNQLAGIGLREDRLLRVTEAGALIAVDIGGIGVVGRKGDVAAILG